MLAANRMIWAPILATVLLSCGGTISSGHQKKNTQSAADSSDSLLDIKRTGGDDSAIDDMGPVEVPKGSFHLVAKAETLLKVDQKDGRDLDESQKCHVPLGSSLILKGLAGPSGGHQQAQEILTFQDKEGNDLTCSLKSIWLFAPHFENKSAPPPSTVAGPGDSTQTPSPQGYVWPTKGRGIRYDAGGAGHFGAPRRGYPHQGIDILAAIGEPIYATDSGTLRIAGTVGAYGYLTELTHSGNRSSRYGHLHSFVVRSVGSSVLRGQRIAVAGKSGNAAGSLIKAHLHFEIREKGTLVDPIKRLPK